MPRLKKCSDLHPDDSQSDTPTHSHILVDKNQPNRDSDSLSQAQQSGSQGSQSKPGSKGTNEHSYRLEIDANQNVAKGKNKRSKQPIQSTYRKLGEGKYNADQIFNRVRQQCVQNQENNITEQQTSIQIPSDALLGLQKKNRKSKSKNKIKLKNKFFNIEVSADGGNIQTSNGLKRLSQKQEQQIKNLQQQNRKLQDIKNEKNALIMDERRNQIQQKVNRIRERLQFKNAHDDIRFKQHFRQTLHNVSDCDEVELMIDAPKIFKGASAKHADAALFIKNMSQKQSHISCTTHSSQQAQHCERSVNRQVQRDMELKNKLGDVTAVNQGNGNKKIDRKQFYQQFTKQVKQIKAVDMPTSTQCLFKKSSLEDLQSEFEKNEHLFKQLKEETNSKLRHSIVNRSHNVGVRQKSRNTLEKQQSIRSKRQSQQKHKQNQGNERLGLIDNEQSRANKVNQIRESLNRRNGPIPIIKQQKQKQIEESKDRQKCKKQDAVQTEQKAKLQKQIKQNQKQMQIIKANQKQSRQIESNNEKQNDVNNKIKKSKARSKSNKKQSINNNQQNKEDCNNKKEQRNRSKSGKKIKEKNNDKDVKQRKKRLTKQQKFSKQIKQLFEQQAEQETNAYGDNNGYSSESDDDQSVQSLIDRNQIKYVDKNQREAHKKWRIQQAKRQQQLMQRIKQRILVPRKIKCPLQQTSQSRKRRLLRLDEAKKKFEEEDANIDGKIVDYDYWENDQQLNSNNQQSSNQSNFEKQLDHLGEELGICNQQKEKPKQKQKSKPKQRTKSKQKLVSGGSVLNIGPIVSKNGKRSGWKQIKILSKKEKQKQRKWRESTGEQSINNILLQKRGGFIQSQKAGVAGTKIAAPTKKNTSKPKSINF